VAFFVYVQKHRQNKLDKQQQEEELQNGHQTNGHQNFGADVTDGPLPCFCQQSQIQFSQLRSNNRSLNGDNDELQHPQHAEFNVLTNNVQCPHHKPKRPFGPHHYHPLSMAEAIQKR
jgi:hypothetical protein